MSMRNLARNTILNLLKNSSEPLSTSEICDKTGLSYASVVRLMRELARVKQVKRMPGGGHSYQYKFLSDTPTVRNKHGELSIPNYTPAAKLSSEELYQQLIDWADKGPKYNLQDSTNAVLYTVAKLYNAARWVARGNTLANSDMDDGRKKLEHAKFMLEKTIGFIDRLLATPQLWSGAQLSSFLLEGRDLETVNSHMHAVLAQSDTK